MAATVKKHKIKLREVNRHLVCRLCRGYYVDATTISECLHSFCRSCIIKYLEKNSFCPICEVQIHKTKPYLNLRLDKALQDVVYKLVPGLFHDEMKRRREFYAKNPEQIPSATPEQCGLEDRLIFSPEDSISLSLEYLDNQDFENESVSSRSSESGDNPEGLSFPQQLGLMKLKKNDGKNSRRESQDVQEPPTYPKRYLQCPAVVNVSHLKKFIRMKYDLTAKQQVDIIHKRVPLPDHYTLMDVAYIYTWKRSAPMRFFYQIQEMKKERIKVPTVATVVRQAAGAGAATGNKTAELPARKKSQEGETKVEKTVENEVETSRVDTNLSSAKQVEKENICKQNTDSSASANGESGAKEVKSDNKASENQTNMAPVQKEQKEVCKVKTVKKLEPPIIRSDSVPKLFEVKKELSTAEKDSESERKVVENKPKETDKSVSSSETCHVPLKTPEKLVASTPVGMSEKTGNLAGETRKNEVVPIKTEKLEVGVTDPKKSSVNLLKNFRKEKTLMNRSNKVNKVEVKNTNGNSVTITTISKRDKPSELEEANVSIEIKAEKKSCEYDFESSSPPSKIMTLHEYTKSEQYKNKFGKDPNSYMSLQGLRKPMINEGTAGDDAKKDKQKSVPSLYRIGTDAGKKSAQKTPNGKTNVKCEEKCSPPPTIINIKTENQNSKTEIKIAKVAPPKPIKIANRGGEYCIKAEAGKPGEEKKVEKQIDQKIVKEESPKMETIMQDPKYKEYIRLLSKRPKEGVGKTELDAAVVAKKVKIGNEGAKSEVKTKVDSKDESSIEELRRALMKRPGQCSVGSEVNMKRAKSVNGEPTKSDLSGVIDLSKNETSSKTDKKSPVLSKNGENVLELLVSISKNQNVENLLKAPQAPQFFQGFNGSPSQVSPTQGKKITEGDVSQALQFFQKLSSSAKSQLSPTSHSDTKSQKSPNLAMQQFCQQQFDLIRMLKRQQYLQNETSPVSKHPNHSPEEQKQKKMSPVGEGKAKARKSPQLSPTKEEAALQFKSSVERGLGLLQMQEHQAEMHRMAQNFKNLPALLQYFNRPTAMYRPGPASPSKSNTNKPKSSSHSPNSQKSPGSQKSPSSVIPSVPLLVPNPEPHFLAAQNHLFPGLSSDMSYHQMFESYLHETLKLNQRKVKPKEQQLSPPSKPTLTSSNLVNEFHFGPQGLQKKLNESSPMPPSQKT